MFRFFRFIVILFLLYLSWPFIQKQLAGTNFETAIESIQSNLKENPQVAATIETIYEEMQQALKQLNLEALPQTQPKIAPVKKETLKKPARQVFSVYNVELGDTKADIERHLGAAKRSTMNEYGTKWFTYHDHYQNFIMVMYDQNNKAVGLYTDQDLISSTNGIKLGSKKADVRAKLGEPITRIQKGLMIYQLQENEEYDLFLLNGVYATIFYDKHENETVTAIQLINKNVEQKKTDIYTKASPALKEGFEYQLFDLTNASRVNHQLPILTWDQHVRETARKHSTDMAVHHYFDHTDLKGKSPFDRMADDHIIFHLAGENLAYGQFSSIFAHEGLMNSLGHRENILRNGYEFLGVGVDFNNQSQPYYTENFYAK
ncbi:CAP domain-containing protein [Neobacillus sp. PS3-34]|uniref:CAP domain-containing protein n=1 Tax=Neobacillus sp. PS3-34 TaxID=3070678 RepID=UPI0027E0449F|nr:CAP domain-containing protein [Neobacillus sp. PS3-34]WML48567.1 CAP domain-containing protein [Neobacillus sp. PS3-34]